MGENNGNKERPFWVRFCLFGVPGRGSALAFYWISMIVGLGAGAVLCILKQIPLGILVLVGGLAASISYQQAIKWMDQNDAW